MKRVFGLLVETAEVVTRPRPGVLLTGPAIGTLEPEQLVTVRGAFSTPTRSTVLAVVQFHRTPLPAKLGVVLPESGIAPRTLVGGVLYEEGALFRVFGAFINAPARRSAARFLFSDGAASGLVRVQRNIIDAFVLGGGLAETRSLWEGLREIQCADGASIHKSELKEPMGEAWLVPALSMYTSGNDTMIIAPPCGPATPNISLLSWGISEIPAEVRLQQASGIVQVGVDCQLERLPRTLIGNLSSSQSLPQNRGDRYAY